MPDGSFISVFLCYKNKSAFNAHLKLHKQNELYLLFPVYQQTGHLVGGERTSSICRYPSDQWNQILASWPVGLDQQEKRTKRRVFSVTDSNDEAEEHN